MYLFEWSQSLLNEIDGDWLQDTWVKKCVFLETEPALLPYEILSPEKQLDVSKIYSLIIRLGQK